MNLKDVDLRKLYNRWKKDLGCFRCFFRSTMFVSLQTYNDFVISEYKSEFNIDILNKILEVNTKEYFTIVDLNLNEILDLSLVLNNEHNIKCILNINLLFNHFGLIGNEENISKLINCGQELKEIEPSSFVMMIPYDRYNEEINAEEVYDKLNNQYEISEEDLPNAEFLKSQKYKGITVITKSKVKEDLLNYINAISKDIDVNVLKVE